MTVDDRILRLIEKLKAGKNVSDRALKRTLSNKDYQDYQSDLLSYKNKSRPKELGEYQAKIKLAILSYSKMEKYSASGKHILAKKYANRAESEFEDALEYINEMIQSNNDINLWLDRSPRGISDFDPMGIPRVIGSKTAYCLNKNKSPYPKFTIKEIRLMFLEGLIEKTKNDLPEKSQFSSLRKKLDTSGFKF